MNPLFNIIPEDLYDNLYSMLLDNPFLGINIIDANKKVVFVNKAHSRITEQPSTDYIGKDLDDLLKNKIFGPSASKAVFETGKDVLLTQSVSSGKSFQVKGIPVFDESGTNIKYVLNYLVDISELVAIREQLSKIQADKEKIEDKYKALRKTLVDSYSLIYQSKPMSRVVEIAKKVADSDAAVLIMGASGVGKELVADVIHEESKRKGKPFIKINCAAIPETLLESELFGYEAGSFTGGNKNGKKGLIELAEGGSLLLDEIGEMPISLQAKLLRVIQDYEVRRIGGNKTIKVNMRLIASTNACLKDLIAEKKFREDLYYRLSIIELRVPGLSERKEDIPLLVQHFTEMFNSKYGKNKSFQPSAISYLVSRDYPGNVRELRNIVERMIIQTTNNIITEKDVYETFGILKVEFKNSDISIDLVEDKSYSLKELVAEYEKKILEEYLRIYNTESAVARKLKTDQSTVSRKLNRYNIQCKNT